MRELIKSQVWECFRCKRFAYRLPRSWNGETGDKDWSCDSCGNTSVRLRGPGRPFGPKCRHYAWIVAAISTAIKP